MLAARRSTGDHSELNSSENEATHAPHEHPIASPRASRRDSAASAASAKPRVTPTDEQLAVEKPNTDVRASASTVESMGTEYESFLLTAQMRWLQLREHSARDGSDSEDTSLPQTPRTPLPVQVGGATILPLSKLQLPAAPLPKSLGGLPSR